MRVAAVGEASYRGEVYFVPAREARAQRADTKPVIDGEHHPLDSKHRERPGSVLAYLGGSSSTAIGTTAGSQRPPYHAQPRNGLLVRR